MRTRAIYGCAGVELDAAERDFFRAARPFGFILFARNLVDGDQIRALVAALRETVEDDRVPVLDMPVAGADQVIGDRAFASDPTTIIDLGRAQIEGLLEGGVVPVMKHIPGHGRAMADSHFALPRVATEAEELSATDFVAFRSLSTCPMAMTAHVVYEALDPQRPATTSPKVIRDVIRGEIGFEGLLISDDLSMNALDGPLSVRTKAALFAGCD